MVQLCTVAWNRCKASRDSERRLWNPLSRMFRYPADPVSPRRRHISGAFKCPRRSPTHLCTPRVTCYTIIVRHTVHRLYLCKQGGRARIEQAERLRDFTKIEQDDREGGQTCLWPMRLWTDAIHPITTSGHIPSFSKLDYRQKSHYHGIVTGAPAQR